MQAVSLDRPNLPQAAIVALAYVVALGVLGLVAAYWAWTWLAPRPAAPVPGPGAVEANGASADDLFGHAERDGGSSSNAASFRLVGLVAATIGYAAYAVVQVDSNEFVTVREGDEVSPGIRLVQVGVDFAIIERDGSRETLVWPDKDATAAPPESPDEAMDSMS